MDVRVITATNREIPAMVQKGLFRQDLYYRLSTITVEIPPLRARTGDIDLLVQQFAARLNLQFGSNKRFSDESLELLRRYSWPGNVRELLHVVEAALVLCEGSTVLPDHLPGALRNPGPIVQSEAVALAPQATSLEAAERAHIVAALEACGGHRGNTAKALGISERNLYRKLREYSLLS